MRVIVTGGAGRIGRALVEALQSAGIQAVSFDIGDDPSLDVTQTDRLLDRVVDVDGVIWLAAISSIKAAETQPDLCWEVNVAAVERFLTSAEKLSRPPWLVLISSREVYGEQRKFPVAESASLHPINSYGRSKVAAEQLVIDRRANLPAANIVRLSNVYGFKGSHGDLISNLIESGISGIPVRLSAGEIALDFTHIDDVVRGILAIARRTHQGHVLPNLHLVSGAATPISQLCKIVSCTLERPIESTETPIQPFEVSKFQGDPSFAEKVLGWRAAIAIDDGIGRMAAHFESQ